MGFFDFLLPPRDPIVLGAIVVDYGKELMKGIISWADSEYLEHCKNGEKAFACLVLRGQALFRRFYFFQGEALCYSEDIITENLSQMHKECLTTEQMDELKRNRYLIIKRY